MPANKQTRRKAQAGAFPAMSMKGYEPMFEAQRSSLAAAAEAQTRMARRVAELSAEIVRFVDNRVEKDRALAHDLAACKSPQEVMALWTAYYEGTVRDYSEQIGALAGLSVDQAREAMDDAQHEVEAAVEPLIEGDKTEEKPKAKRAAKPRKTGGAGT